MFCYDKKTALSLFIFTPSPALTDLVIGVRARGIGGGGCRPRVGQNQHFLSKHSIFRALEASSRKWKSSY